MPPSAAEQAEIDKAREMARQVDAAVVVLGESDDLVGESRRGRAWISPASSSSSSRPSTPRASRRSWCMLNGRPMTINWIDRNVPGDRGGLVPGGVLRNGHRRRAVRRLQPVGQAAADLSEDGGPDPVQLPVEARGADSDRRAARRRRRRRWSTARCIRSATGSAIRPTATPTWRSSPGTQPPSGTVAGVGGRGEHRARAPATEIVQLYLVDEVTSVVYYDKVLRGFERVPLQPGEKKTRPLHAGARRP